MKKFERLEVYNKYNGHCAYCGKKIEYKDMQVDHQMAKCNGGTDDLDNLFPSCRSCNHYKRSMGLEAYRDYIKTLHERIRKIYICKVAEDYGIIKIEPWNGKFYFERVDRKCVDVEIDDLRTETAMKYVNNALKNIAMNKRKVKQDKPNRSNDNNRW